MVPSDSGSGVSDREGRRYGVVHLDPSLCVTGIDGDPDVAIPGLSTGDPLPERVADPVRSATVDGGKDRVRIDDSTEGVVVPRPEGLTLVVRDVDPRTRTRYLETVHEAARGMMRAESKEEVCEVTADAIAAAVDLCTVDVLLFSPEEYVLRPAASAGDDAGDRPSEISDDDNPVWTAFREGSVQRRGTASLSNADLGAEVIVPLSNHGVVVAARDGSFPPAAFASVRALASNAEAALDRTDREWLLRTRERELDAKATRLQQLADHVDTVRSAVGSVIEATGRSAVIDALCRELSTRDEYRFAVTYEYDRGRSVLRPATGAAIDVGVVPSVGVAEDGDERPDHPAAAACRSGEVTVLDDAVRRGSLRAAALERDFQSLLAFPVEYRDRLFGVGIVAAAPGYEFGDGERRLLGELGSVVGYAISVVELRGSVLSDDFTRVELRVPDETAFHVWLAGRIGGRVDHDALFVDGSETAVYATLSGTDAEAVRDLADDADRIRSVRVLDESDAPFRCRFEVRDPVVLRSLGVHSGVVRDVEAETGAGTYTVDFPSSAHVREAIAPIRTQLSGVELRGRRRVTDPGDDTGSLRDALASRLTDRQFDVLLAAYEAGYFDEPRERSGAEIAAQLDINQSTFHGHLRAAHRRLLAAAFDGS